MPFLYAVGHAKTTERGAVVTDVHHSIVVENHTEERGRTRPLPGCRFCVCVNIASMNKLNQHYSSLLLFPPITMKQTPD